MKTYTEPKLEIVTLNASDVITTSGSFADLFSADNIEQHSNTSNLLIDNLVGQ